MTAPLMLLPLHIFPLLPMGCSYCQESAPTRILHALQVPSNHIHLLQHGTPCWMQSVYLLQHGPPQAAEQYLLHHSFSTGCRGSSFFPLDAFRAVSDTFPLTSRQGFPLPPLGAAIMAAGLSCVLRWVHWI